jgi:hypothetical protein
VVEHKEIEVLGKMRQLQEELGVDSDEEVGADEDGEESHDLFGAKHKDFKKYMQEKQYVLHSRVRIELMDCNCASLTAHMCGVLACVAMALRVSAE